MIYATFIVTTLVRERVFSESLAGNFWMWVGFLSLFPGPAVAGVLAERTGSFSSSFFMAAAFAGAAIVLSGFLRKPRAA